MPAGARHYLLVWLALMSLLAMTVAATFAPLGPLKPAVNLGAALAKAGLILWAFMHLREQSGLNRLPVFIVVAWLAVLLTLIGADIAERRSPNAAADEPNFTMTNPVAPSQGGRGTGTFVDSARSPTAQLQRGGIAGVCFIFHSRPRSPRRIA